MQPEEQIDFKSIDWKFSPKQTQAKTIIMRPEVTDLCYGGAKGGGKSYFLCRFFYLFAKYIIKEYKLIPMKYPIVLGFLGRKQSVDFTHTTLETWKKSIPPDAYEIRIQDKEIVIENTVKYHFGGLDDSEMINKFNSAEYAIIGLDQAEETSKEDLGMLRATLRLMIDGREVPYKIILTCNPANCYIKEDYVLNTTDKSKVFLQALPSDNPFLPQSYINTLHEAFKHRPELITAYIKGSWDMLEGDDIVIQSSWIENCVDSDREFGEIKRLVSVDPSGYGDDETVIYGLDRYAISEQEILSKKSDQEVAWRVTEMLDRIEGYLVAIDCTGGYGKGIADLLDEKIGTDRVLRLNYASEPMGETEDEIIKLKERYYNLRAQMYWEAGKSFSEGKASIPNDPVLRLQLNTPKYTIKNGRILIEPKEDIKKRMGKSSDRADCYVQGIFALRFCPAIYLYAEDTKPATHAIGESRPRVPTFMQSRRAI